MMILIPRRAPRPDARWWPGRRVLATLDALAWPAVGLVLLAFVPIDTGIAGRTTMALLVVVAMRRVYRALLHNERYWFTTWRWAGPLALLGALMKVWPVFGY